MGVSFFGIGATALRWTRVFAIGCFMLGLASPHAMAQTLPQPLQTQETNFSGIVADLVDCNRKDGVLTVKVRFRGMNDAKSWFSIDTHHGAYDGFYVLAANKKYFILRDTEKEPLAPKYLGGVNLGKGDMHQWWAKFPAPPANVKQVKLVIPQMMPFEDVPITDK